MIRKTVRLTLTVASILLALGCMISHWHPIHVSDVWDQGAQWVNSQGGGAYWYYQAQRNQFRSAQPYTYSTYYLPGGLSFSTTSDGRNMIGVPGIRFDWCRQTSGYRQFGLSVSFFKLAFLFALYPTLSITVPKVRRFIRRRRGLCLNCAYDLTGNLSGVCPECGSATSTSDHPQDR